MIRFINQPLNRSFILMFLGLSLIKKTATLYNLLIGGTENIKYGYDTGFYYGQISGITFFIVVFLYSLYVLGKPPLYQPAKFNNQFGLF